MWEGGCLCSWLGPGCLSTSDAGYCQVSFYFVLVGDLGLFDAPPQVSSGSAVESSVSRPEGRVTSSDQGLDFLCHPGLSVWKDPDASILGDVIYTAPDVEEDRLGVCVQVLIFENAPVCAGKAVLQLVESIFRPGFDGLGGWFCLPSEGGVGREEEQREVV